MAENTDFVVKQTKGESLFRLAQAAQIRDRMEELCENTGELDHLQLWKQAARDSWLELTPDEQTEWHVKSEQQSGEQDRPPPIKHIYDNQRKLLPAVVGALAPLCGYDWNQYGDVVFFVQGAYRIAEGQIKTFHVSVQDGPTGFGSDRIEGHTIGFRRQFKRWAEEVLPIRESEGPEDDVLGGVRFDSSGRPILPPLKMDAIMPCDLSKILQKVLEGLWACSAPKEAADRGVPWALINDHKAAFIKNADTFRRFKTLEPTKMIPREVFELADIIRCVNADQPYPFAFIVGNEGRQLLGLGAGVQENDSGTDRSPSRRRAPAPVPGSHPVPVPVRSQFVKTTAGSRPALSSGTSRPPASGGMSMGQSAAQTPRLPGVPASLQLPAMRRPVSPISIATIPTVFSESASDDSRSSVESMLEETDELASSRNPSEEPRPPSPSNGSNYDGDDGDEDTNESDEGDLDGEDEKDASSDRRSDSMVPATRHANNTRKSSNRRVKDHQPTRKVRRNAVPDNDEEMAAARRSSTRGVTKRKADEGRVDKSQRARPKRARKCKADEEQAAAVSPAKPKRATKRQADKEQAAGVQSAKPRRATKRKVDEDQSVIEEPAKRKRGRETATNNARKPVKRLRAKKDDNVAGSSTPRRSTRAK